MAKAPRINKRRAASRPAPTKSPRVSRSATPRAPVGVARRVYLVDAFTRRPFHGNPAAVVIVEGRWPADDAMHALAVELNQPMTAFVLSTKGKRVGLRWFNAVKEFDLCGHATLAAAHVLWTHEKRTGDSITFSTLGGDIPVSRSGGRVSLTLQSRPAVRVRATNALCAALGRQPSEVHHAGMTMAVFENKRDVHAIEPDFARLAALDASGVIITAPGAGHDFVSRFFAPRHGLNEDHATGSSHTLLVPYWARRLGKTRLSSHQVSRRSGEFWCEHAGDRTIISGHATTVGRGTVTF